jgi:hypothetical protein
LLCMQKVTGSNPVFSTQSEVALFSLHSALFQI